MRFAVHLHLRSTGIGIYGLVKTGIHLNSVKSITIKSNRENFINQISYLRAGEWELAGAEFQSLLYTYVFIILIKLFSPTFVVY